MEIKETHTWWQRLNIDERIDQGHKRKCIFVGCGMNGDPEKNILSEKQSWKDEQQVRGGSRTRMDMCWQVPKVGWKDGTLKS